MPLGLDEVDEAMAAADGANVWAAAIEPFVDNCGASNGEDAGTLLTAQPGDDGPEPAPTADGPPENRFGRAVASTVICPSIGVVVPLFVRHRVMALLVCCCRVKRWREWLSRAQAFVEPAAAATAALGVDAPAPAVRRAHRCRDWRCGVRFFSFDTCCGCGCVCRSAARGRSSCRCGSRRCTCPSSTRSTTRAQVPLLLSLSLPRSAHIHALTPVLILLCVRMTVQHK